MKAVIQRVSTAQVITQGKLSGRIQYGLLVLLCVLRGDGEEDVFLLCEKIPKLRIFEDEQGKMNRSLMDVKGQVLVVSQFTLAADLKKGLRPSFETAADPQTAEALYQKFRRPTPASRDCSGNRNVWCQDAGVPHQ